MEFGREIIGNSGDDDSVFECFTGDNFIQVGDFNALPNDNTSDEDGNTLLILSTESQTRVQDVQEVVIIEDLIQFITACRFRAITQLWAVFFCYKTFKLIADVKWVKGPV